MHITSNVEAVAQHLTSNGQAEEESEGSSARTRTKGIKTASSRRAHSTSPAPLPNAVREMHNLQPHTAHCTDTGVCLSFRWEGFFFSLSYDATTVRTLSCL